MLTRLVVISGPPGSGKSTLSRQLARELGYSLLARDAVYEEFVSVLVGMGDALPADLTTPVFDRFVQLIGEAVAIGKPLIVEAAFQHTLWCRVLAAVLPKVELRVVHCRVDAQSIRHRLGQRVAGSTRRVYHADAELLQRLDQGDSWPDKFERLRLPVPTLEVDSSDGYVPEWHRVIEFCR